MNPTIEAKKAANAKRKADYELFDRILKYIVAASFILFNLYYIFTHHITINISSCGV
jgi:hypothetical protein